MLFQADRHSPQLVDRLFGDPPPHRDVVKRSRAYLNPEPGCGRKRNEFGPVLTITFVVSASDSPVGQN